MLGSPTPTDDTAATGGDNEEEGEPVEVTQGEIITENLLSSDEDGNDNTNTEEAIGDKVAENM